jgi:hypothetical protein
LIDVGLWRRATATYDLGVFGSSGLRSDESANQGARVRTGARRAALVWAAIVAFYGIFGLVILAPEAVYSGDIGVKYVQARALADHGFSSLELPYPGEFLDPQRQFFPFRPPFVMVASGKTQAIYSPSAAIVQAAAARIAGIRGFILVSVLSAALILYCAWKLVPEGDAILVLVMLGIGGPLWFYAVSGWEHAPGVALCTAAFLCAVRLRGPGAAFAAGVLLGAGAAVRDEAVLLVPGLLVCLWMARRDVRPLAAAVAGIVLVLCSAAAVEVFWFARPAAAHLRHAVHFLQSALHLTGEPNLEVPVLQPFTLLDKYETVVYYWLFGSDRNDLIGLFAIGYVAALALRAKWRTPAGLLLWLCGLSLVAIADLREVLTAPKWLAGLVHVAPWAALALLPPAIAGGRQPVVRMIVVTSAIYMAGAFLGADTHGGKSLGPRLLLPLVPLLAVAAAIRLNEYRDASGRVNAAIAAVGLFLVAAGVAFHLGGTVRAYHYRNNDDASAVLAIAAMPDRIVIADDAATAQLLMPLYYRKIILLADSEALGRELGQLLANQRMPGAVVVSRRPEPLLDLPGLRLESTEQQGRMRLQRWRR